jgi:dTDP-4-dehydrorhamnose 3,5-epimerase
MIVNPTSLVGVFVVRATSIDDRRGSFSRFFCERELGELIGSRRIVQINRSRTSLVGAVRGMHYQRAPQSEMKLVRCLSGRVFDVAVDLRRSSPTFLHWHAEELSSNNEHMMIIPEGCAHGFQVLESESELLYLHTAFYSAELEEGIIWDDPRIGIAWPLAVTELSARDSAHPRVPLGFVGLPE